MFRVVLLGVFVIKLCWKLSLDSLMYVVSATTVLCILFPSLLRYKCCFCHYCLMCGVCMIRCGVGMISCGVCMIRCGVYMRASVSL